MGGQRNKKGEKNNKNKNRRKERKRKKKNLHPTRRGKDK